MLRTVSALVLVALTSVIAPGLARADLTVTTNPTSSNVQVGAAGCGFKAMGSPANVNVAAITGCIASDGAVSIENEVYGDVDIDAPIDATSACSYISIDTDGPPPDGGGGSGSVAIDAPITAPCALYLTTWGSGLIAASITQTASGAIDVPTLETNSYDVTTLQNAQNEVGSWVAVSSQGGVSLSDQEAVDLQINSGGGVAVNDPAGITAVGAVSGSGATDLLSSGGPVSENDGASMTGIGTLNVQGVSVHLPGNNDPSRLFEASATDGDLSASLSTSGQVFLGNVSASGAVDISDEAAQVGLTAPISGESVTLAGDGFQVDTGGTVQAATVDLIDGDTSDAWTLTPAELELTGYQTIPYSGASRLTVDGGASFNVTPSSTTAYSVSSGGPSAGTLTYNANGETVSGTLQAPAGVIDGSGVQSVSFTDMTTVDIVGAAAVESDGGSDESSSGAAAGSSSGGSTRVSGGPAVSDQASVSPASSSAHVVVCQLRKPSGKPISTGQSLAAWLAVVVSCDGAASISVSGGVTVTADAKTRKLTNPQAFALATTHKQTIGKAQTRLLIAIPRAVLLALRQHARAAARFKLTFTTSGRQTTALATVNLE